MLGVHPCGGEDGGMGERYPGQNCANDPVNGCGVEYIDAEQRLRQKCGTQDSGNRSSRTNECRFHRCQFHDLRARCTADTQQRLIAPPADAAGGHDRDGEESRQQGAGRAEEQKQHFGIQRIAAHCIEPCREIVRDYAAAGDSYLEIFRRSLDRDKSRIGIVGQSGVFKPDMQLNSDRVRPDCRLRIEQAMPFTQRHQHYIVGRRLRRRTGRNPDSLEHRIGIRQIDDASDCDIHRGKSGAMDGHDIAHHHMQVGGGLLRDEHALQGTNECPELPWIVACIRCIDTDHLAFTCCLDGAAGMRLETVDFRVTGLVQG